MKKKVLQVVEGYWATRENQEPSVIDQPIVIENMGFHGEITDQNDYQYLMEGVRTGKLFPDENLPLSENKKYKKIRITVEEICK